MGALRGEQAPIVRVGNCSMMSAPQKKFSKKRHLDHGLCYDYAGLPFQHAVPLRDNLHPLPTSLPTKASWSVLLLFSLADHCSSKEAGLCLPPPPVSPLLSLSSSLPFFPLYSLLIKLQSLLRGVLSFLPAWSPTHSGNCQGYSHHKSFIGVNLAGSPL